MGDLNIDPKFQQVTIKALVETSESEERIEEMQKAVDLRCPILRTIKDAGISVKNEWMKAEPSA